MAEEKKQLPNPDIYQYAKAGIQFLQAKDVKSAGKCLEKLASDMKVPEENKPFLVWNATANDPNSEIRQYGMTKGLEIALGKYEEEMGKFTMGQMFERYSAEFDKYLGEEERLNAKSIFDTLTDKTYGSIIGKVAELQDKINSKSDAMKSEREKAQKEYDEKYARIYETIQDFEGLRIGKLMNPIHEDSIKSEVQERFKVEKKAA